VSPYRAAPATTIDPTPSLQEKTMMMANGIQAPAGYTARLRLSHLVAAEWIKLRSLRAAVLAIASAALLGFGAGMLQLLLYKADAQHVTMSAEQVMADSLASGRYGALIGLAVLGVLALGSEYGTGAIRGTLVVAPRRLHVMAAKVVVVSTVAATTTLLSLGAVGVAAIPLVSAAGLGEVPVGGVIAATAAGVGFEILVVSFALAVTLLVRSTAIGISATLGALLVFPILLNVIASVMRTDLTTLSFTSAASSVMVHPLSSALPVVLAWLAAPALLGGAALVRRDV
jgi:ABC-2 type transport system permease protein